ncbi:hypothetical protein MKK65_00755 [Methylobacterium sp. J-001]|uniref:hypothetical protein n=1 Tax=Methylobacterium sp. J-001 TaxID=2836609 RepID=UPI001FBB8BCA|nr:hypothetical protein [Methylobacterium sp. J-001]MCJ2115141.1 hypothetical protein [Methylobacterium sp. J-001]
MVDVVEIRIQSCYLNGRSNRCHHRICASHREFNPISGLRRFTGARPEAEADLRPAIHHHGADDCAVITLTCNSHLPGDANAAHLFNLHDAIWRPPTPNRHGRFDSGSMNSADRSAEAVFSALQMGDRRICIATSLRMTGSAPVPVSERLLPPGP